MAMDTDSQSLRLRMEQGRQMAVEAGQITLQYFGRSIDILEKSDGSPVTIADQQAEQHLRRRIQNRFPGDGIVGEEFGIDEGESGFRWILDPIDGTKSFIAGVPLYGTMVGLEQDGEPAGGIIYFPGLDVLIHATRGEGCWYGPPGQAAQPARVSQATSLAEGLFVTTDLRTFQVRNARAVFHALDQRCRLTRTWGDCYGYFLVATGRALVMIDPMLSVWDAAALMPILEEAGGAFTDWQGRRTIEGGDGIGCNQHVLAEVVEITKGVGATS